MMILVFANQHGGRLCYGTFDPYPDIIERLESGQIVHYNGSIGPAIVDWCLRKSQHEAVQGQPIGSHSSAAECYCGAEESGKVG